MAKKYILSLTFLILLVGFFFLPLYPQPMEKTSWGGVDGVQFEDVETDWEWVSMNEFIDEYQYLIPYKKTITVVNFGLLILYPALIVLLGSQLVKLTSRKK